MSVPGAWSAPPRASAAGVSQSGLTHDCPAALVIAHPGHELRVLGWLQIARPVVHILTDGSGHTNQSRIPSSERVLTAAGADRGSIFGRLRDKDLYAALLRHDHSTFTDVADELSAALVAGGVQMVLGDASEGYNPGHDVCRLIIDAAVTRAVAAGGGPIANFEFSLVSRPDTCDETRRDRAIWVQLDDEVFARKMATARAYPELADEVERSIVTLGMDAFRTECLRPAPASTSVPDETPYYEMHGANQVTAGHYERTLRYQEHVRPVALALQEWSRAGVNQ
jgi:hypothetical protein